jgi:ubiquinone/menaquinone biosynthesis C-methylase UbiE
VNKNLNASEKYLQRIERSKKFGYDIKEEREFIVKMSEPLEDPILEIGTGRGHLAIALAQKGYHLTSVDLSEEEQREARSNIECLGLDDNIDLQTEDASSMSFKDKSFKTILIINVVHHLADPFKVVDEILRVLIPGGKIVISDFSKQGFDVLDKIFASEGGEHHVGKFDLCEVESYLSLKGLMIKKHNREFQDIIIVKA